MFSVTVFLYFTIKTTNSVCNIWRLYLTWQNAQGRNFHGFSNVSPQIMALSIGNVVTIGLHILHDNSNVTFLPDDTVAFGSLSFLTSELVVAGWSFLLRILFNHLIKCYNQLTQELRADQ